MVLRSNKDSVRRMGSRSFFRTSELELELKMPKNKESIHKRGVLKRQITSGAGIVYSSRTVIVTAERIYFSRIGNDDVLDYIPLVEIEVPMAHMPSTIRTHMSRMSSRVQGVRGYLSSKSEKVVPVTVASQEEAGSESQEEVNQDDDKISRLGSWPSQQEGQDMKNEEMIGSNAERKKWQLARMGSSLGRLGSSLEEILDSTTFAIRTILDGHNSGRSTILKACNENERNEWESFIFSAAKRALEVSQIETRKTWSGTPGLTILQKKCQDFYASSFSQVIFGVFIMASIVTSIVQCQLIKGTPVQQDETYDRSVPAYCNLPDDSIDKKNIKSMEIVFTIVFTVELFINLVGNWFKPFVINPWNWM